MSVTVIVPPAIGGLQQVVGLDEYVVYGCGKHLVLLNGNSLQDAMHVNCEIKGMTLFGPDTIAVSLTDRTMIFLAVKDGKLKKCPSISGCNLENLEEYTVLCHGNDRALIAIENSLYIAQPFDSKWGLRRLLANIDFVSVEFLESSTFLLSEKNGVHSLWLYEGDGLALIWTIHLGIGSAVIPFHVSKHAQCIPEERRQLLETFHYTILSYSLSGELVFYGIQVNVVAGVKYFRGEPIFSYSLSDNCLPAHKLHIFTFEHRLLVKILGVDPPFSIIVDPFVEKSPTVSTEYGFFVTTIDSVGSVCFKTEKYLYTLSDLWRGVRFLEALPFALLSKYEVCEHVGILNGKLMHTKDLEAKYPFYVVIDGTLILTEDGVLTSVPAGQVNSEMKNIDIPQNILDPVTDLPLVSKRSIYSVRCGDDEPRYEVRNRTDHVILSTPISSTFVGMIDPFTAMVRTSSGDVEIAPLRDPAHMYSVCKVSLFLSFKSFVVPENKRVVVIHCSDSIDVMVKVFKNGKIVWSKIAKLQQAFPITDYTLDEESLYLCGLGGLVSQKINLKATESYPMVGFSRISVQDFDTVSVCCPALFEQYSHMKHMRDGIDVGFINILLWALFNTKDVSVPAGLIHFSYLTGYISDCSSQLMEHLCKFIDTCSDWTGCSRTGFPMWIKAMPDLSHLTEHICKILAKKNLAGNIDIISILFTLLKKEKTLVAIWRASHNSEAEKVISFLQQSSSKEHQAVAEKSAFALLAKQREYLAVFFFLLASRPHDAISVCVERLKDCPLAVLIGRTYQITVESSSCLSPIEQFLVSSIDASKEHPWELLLKDPKQIDWWPTRIAIFKVIKERYPVQYKIRDIQELWSHGLFDISLQSIDNVAEDDSTKEQLRFEAKSLLHMTRV